MKSFYFLFDQLIDGRELGKISKKVKNVFSGSDNDLEIGLLICLVVIIILLLTYYVVLGNKTDRYNKNKNWYWLSFIGTSLCFVVTLLVFHYGVLKETDVFFKANKAVWYFSGVNALYCWVFFWPLSLIFNNFSKYYKFIPFNLISRR